jgi:hypothetical protein
MDIIKQSAEACFNFSKRGYNYDFFKAAYKAASHLNKMLKTAKSSAKKEENNEAVAIAKAVAEVIPRNYENVDDSDGVLGDTFDQAIDLLCKIVNKTTVDVYIKKDIYYWSVNEMNNKVYSDFGFDELQTIYELCCKMIGETDEVIADIDRKINEATSEYLIKRTIVWKIRFMQSRNLDVEYVIQSNIDINEVRQIRFRQLLVAKEYDTALTIAMQGIEVAKQKGHPGTELDWQETMLDIYIQQNDTGNLLKMAEYLFLHSSRKYNRDVLYNMLKTHTLASDWQITVERLLSTMEKEPYYNPSASQIMLELQDWSRLFTYCQKGGINEIMKYENDLKIHLEKDILDYYYNYVEKTAQSSDVSAYYEVAKILKHLRTFFGGNELVNQLLEKYRSIYKHRKKMITILKNV